MVVKNKLVVFLATALLVGLAIYFFFPSEEKVIKKQFNVLSESISKNDGESLILMASKLKKLKPLFAEKFFYETKKNDFSGFYNPQQITAQLTAGRSQFLMIDLTFYDLDILMAEDGGAKVVFTAILKGRTKQGDDVNEIHELEAELKKSDGKWQFSKVKVVEVLQK